MTIDNEMIVTLATAAVSIVAAVTSGITAIIASRKAVKLDKLLQEAKDRETYIICPRCKEKLPLSDVEFHLPSGSIDNNLNGKADSEEI